MDLYSESHSGIDISSGYTVLTYTYSGSTTREVIARVNLGSISAPIVGGGTYTLTMYINNVPIMPSSAVLVGTGVTKAAMITRQIPIEIGDVLTIDVIGLGGDTSINTNSILRDVTTITASDIIGPGAVEVNQDYGGTEALSYKTSAGAGIDGASIRAYLKSNYDAGLYSSAFIVGQTTTTVTGGWARSLMLDPEDYTLIYYKQAVFGPDRRNITVA